MHSIEHVGFSNAISADYGIYVCTEFKGKKVVVLVVDQL
jgi:hypothetical protein